MNIYNNYYYRILDINNTTYKTNGTNFGNKYLFYKMFPPIGQNTVCSINRSISDISNILHLRYDKIKFIALTIPETRFQFLDRLAKKYFSANLNLQESEQIPPATVMDIFKQIRRPKTEHFKIIRNSNKGFQDLKEIFKLAGNRKKMQFVCELQQEIVKDNKDANFIIVEMLKSSNIKEYIQNLQKYKSYLKLNLDNKNAIKDLDKLVIGNFDSKKYDIEFINKHFNLNETNYELFNIKNLSENYNADGIELINELPLNDILNGTSGNIENLLFDIYKTTNKDNLILRFNFILKFNYLLGKHPYILDCKQELTCLKTLFDNADSNKNIRKFLEKVLDKDLEFKSFSELDSILTSVEPKKANIFFDNLQRLFENSHTDNMPAIIRAGLTKPFYETRQMKYEREMNNADKLIPFEPAKVVSKTIQNIFYHIRYIFTQEGIPYKTHQKQFAEISTLPQKTTLSHTRRTTASSNPATQKQPANTSQVKQEKNIPPNPTKINPTSKIKYPETGFNIIPAKSFIASSLAIEAANYYSQI